MSFYKAQHQLTLSLLLILVCTLAVWPARATGGAKKAAPLIQTTPPAPVFDAAAMRAELAARRARVAEQLGPKSILVLFSAEPRVYTGDTDDEFRQENNFYYLTGLNKEGATLVLMPGHTALREILFLPRRKRGIQYGT